MVTLREQGFSHREIAEKVQRSERTVRRYTRGVRPQVAVPTKVKRVGVLAHCAQIILYGRDRLELTTQEMDFLFRMLRKTFEGRDPLTRDWLATDSRARVDFLVNEVLRPGMSDIKLRRWIEQFREQIGGGEITDEEAPDDSGPRSDRLLPP
jgi:hypothetical protein